LIVAQEGKGLEDEGGTEIETKAMIKQSLPEDDDKVVVYILV
jgi:hypothetical protein